MKCSRPDKTPFSITSPQIRLPVARLSIRFLLRWTKRASFKQILCWPITQEFQQLLVRGRRRVIFWSLIKTRRSKSRGRGLHLPTRASGLLDKDQLSSTVAFFKVQPRTILILGRKFSQFPIWSATRSSITSQLSPKTVQNFWLRAQLRFQLRIHNTSSLDQSLG